MWRQWSTRTSTSLCGMLVAKIKFGLCGGITSRTLRCERKSPEISHIRVLSLSWTATTVSVFWRPRKSWTKWYRPCSLTFSHLQLSEDELRDSVLLVFANKQVRSLACCLHSSGCISVVAHYSGFAQRDGSRRDHGQAGPQPTPLSPSMLCLRYVNVIFLLPMLSPLSPKIRGCFCVLTALVVCSGDVCNTGRGSVWGAWLAVEWAVEEARVIQSRLWISCVELIMQIK